MKQFSTIYHQMKTAYCAKQMRKRTFDALSCLSNSQLHDIGLNRYHLKEIASGKRPATRSEFNA